MANATVYCKSSLYPGGSKVRHMATAETDGRFLRTWCGRKPAHVLKRGAGSLDATCKACRRSPEEEA